MGFISLAVFDINDFEMRVRHAFVWGTLEDEMPLDEVRAVDGRERGPLNGHSNVISFWKRLCISLKNFVDNQLDHGIFP